METSKRGRVKRMRYIKWLLTFSMLACVATACEIDPPMRIGDACPPAEGGVLAYIHDSFCTAFACELGDGHVYFDSFEKGYCPLNYPKCYKIEEVNPLLGDVNRYYCDVDREVISDCPFKTDLKCDKLEGEIGFDCINPMDDRTCGANRCDLRNANYGGVDCSAIDPLSHCDKETQKCVCRDDALFCDGKCVSPADDKTCGAKNCSGENYAGIDCTQLGDGVRCTKEGDGYACRCRDGQVLCDGKCIDPEYDLNYCGAKGSCSSTDASSDDFKGVSCADGSGICTNGECTCSGANNVWCIIDGVNGNQPKCHSKLEKATCNAKLKADGSLYCDFSPCSDNEQCMINPQTNEGECKVTSCKDNENPCPDGNGGIACIPKSDYANCGYCNLDCSKVGSVDAKVIACELDDRGAYGCALECQDGKTNCGTRFSPLCKNLQNDNSNCGKCGEACDSESTCKAGKCEKTHCAPNTCEAAGCKSTDEACGTNCEICRNFGAEAKCNTGVGKCGFTSCPVGTHPRYEDTIIRVCATNSSVDCAPNTMTLYGTAVNCEETKDSSVATTTCNDSGACEATMCQSGFHLSKADKTKCEANSPKACGLTTSSATTDCTSIAKASKTDCRDGACVVTECASGFHISSDNKSCVANSDSACGLPNSNKVVKCSSPLICKADGTCGCAGGLYPNWNGTSCVEEYCQFIPGVMSGKNRSLNYNYQADPDMACDATVCAPGFTRMKHSILNAWVCQPDKNNCTDMGYKDTTACVARTHSYCQSGYRWYLYVCLDQDVCCGTDLSTEEGSNYYCKNCKSQGLVCNTKTGNCK